jgi:ribonuclease HI
VVLSDSEGNVLKEVAEPLGITTNNVAEYSALIRALEEARALGCSEITILTDSELMARQLNGQYAVKAPHLIPLFQRASRLLHQFDLASVSHTRRANNKHADSLSNIGADRSEAALQSEEDQKQPFAG